MATPSSTGRLVRISLEVVPLEIRRKAADRLADAVARQAKDFESGVIEAARIRAAAERPVGVHYVSEAAVLRVLGAVP